MRKELTGSLNLLAEASSDGSPKQTDVIGRTSIGVRKVAIKSTVPQVMVIIVLVAVNFK